MVDNPAHHFPQIADAPAATASPSTTRPSTTCRRRSPLAREHGLGVGVAFNPETEPEDVAAVASGADLVLCMSIHPGYGGQEFMPEALERDRAAAGRAAGARCTSRSTAASTTSNVRAIYDAGATLIVAGTAIFGREDLPRAYRRLVQALA